MVFAKEKNIFFREDATNHDTELQRNFLRHEILPKFEKINPDYRRAITNFLEYIADRETAQKREVSEWLD